MEIPKNEICKISHIIPQEPKHKNVMDYLQFITYREDTETGKGRHFYSFDIIDEPKEMVERDEAIGNLMKLANPLAINRNQVILLRPDRTVIMADEGERLTNVREIAKLPVLRVTHIIPEMLELGYFPIGFYCDRNDGELIYRGKGNALNGVSGVERAVIAGEVKSGKAIELSNPIVLPLSSNVYLDSRAGIHVGLPYNSREKPVIQLNINNFPIGQPKVYVRGSSHYSSRGKLENNMWYWGVELDGKLNQDTVIKGELGVQFVRDLRPFLPDNHGLRVIHPIHIPGDDCGFNIPLEKTTNPDAVRKVINKYFPRITF